MTHVALCTLSMPERPLACLGQQPTRRSCSASVGFTRLALVFLRILMCLTV